MTEYLLMTLMFITSVFLILLVLVQRGRGGGLAGALGGMGGQSAFGTKAGDTFTRITIGVAAFWIILCAASVKLLGTDQNRFGNDSEQSTSEGNGGGKSATERNGRGKAGTTDRRDRSPGATPGGRTSTRPNRDAAPSGAAPSPNRNK